MSWSDSRVSLTSTAAPTTDNSYFSLASFSAPDGSRALDGSRLQSLKRSRLAAMRTLANACKVSTSRVGGRARTACCRLELGALALTECIVKTARACHLEERFRFAKLGECRVVQILAKLVWLNRSLIKRAFS